MTGYRAYPPECEDPQNLRPGAYFRIGPGDAWHGVAPNGLLANLGGHKVTEHEDGTITVSPSIKVFDGTQTWHGYLERGVWRAC